MFKKYLFFGLVLIPLNAHCEQLTAKVTLVDPSGIGKSIGSVTFVTVKDGVQAKVILNSIVPGDHGFHLHENPSCAPGEKDGKMAAAIGAGGHYDPSHTGKHLGPAGDGHRGDLPALNANKDGVVQQEFLLKRLRLWELKGRSVVVHEGADNYSDLPKPLGGGGARVACGIIE